VEDEKEEVEEDCVEWRNGVAQYIEDTKRRGIQEQ
jgi:hypothetical protein